MIYIKASDIVEYFREKGLFIQMVGEEEIPETNLFRPFTFYHAPTLSNVCVNYYDLIKFVNFYKPIDEIDKHFYFTVYGG